MLTKLRMYITSDDFEITRHISSVLHGVIMSVIDTDYANILHNSNLNPFSTSLVKNGDEWCWTVATVGQEAYNKIFKVIADKSFSSFVLTSKENAVVNIVKKETFEIPVENLLKATFNDEPSSVLKSHLTHLLLLKAKTTMLLFPTCTLFFKVL